VPYATHIHAQPRRGAVHPIESCIGLRNTASEQTARPRPSPR
jgi:hypothetical protein